MSPVSATGMRLSPRSPTCVQTGLTGRGRGVSSIVGSAVGGSPFLRSGGFGIPRFNTTDVTPSLKKGLSIPSLEGVTTPLFLIGVSLVGSPSTWSRAGWTEGQLDQDPLLINRPQPQQPQELPHRFLCLLRLLDRSEGVCQALHRPQCLVDERRPVDSSVVFRSGDSVGRESICTPTRVSFPSVETVCSARSLGSDDGEDLRTGMGRRVYPPGTACPTHGRGGGGSP